MEDRAAIMAWRRAERLRLIEARLQVPVAERQAGRARASASGSTHTAERRPAAVPHHRQRLLADARRAGPAAGLGRLHEAGHITVLPVVVEKNAPLAFRRWFPGAAMEKGFWNIPVPVEPESSRRSSCWRRWWVSTQQCYRLGYGGGYFDRTLELLRSLQVQFHAIGVGFAATELASIHPVAA